MFTNEEYNMIVGVMSQLQFRPGQGEQLKMAESILNKISNTVKVDKLINKIDPKKKQL